MHNSVYDKFLQRNFYYLFYLVHSIIPINHSFSSMVTIVIIISIRDNIEIFDNLFMKMRGVIREISRSKIKKRMIIMKKLIENGIFRMVFSLNPHSKFVFIVFWFFVILRFISKVIIINEFVAIATMVIKFIIMINFFSF